MEDRDVFRSQIERGHMCYTNELSCGERLIVPQWTELLTMCQAWWRGGRKVKGFTPYRSDKL